MQNLGRKAAATKIANAYAKSRHNYSLAHAQNSAQGNKKEARQNRTSPRRYIKLQTFLFNGAHVAQQMVGILLFLVGKLLFVVSDGEPHEN